VIVVALYVSSQDLSVYIPLTCLLKYTICDLTLLFQIYYYRWKRSHPAFHSPNSQDRETDPLLGTSDDGVLPLWVLALRYSAALVFVIAVGLMAWWITYNDEDTDLAQPDLDPKKWWLIQALGWSSALLFVGSHNLTYSLANCRHSWVHEFLRYVSLSFIPQHLPYLWISEKLPNTLRRFIARSLLLRDLRQHDIRVVDLCKEHG
jgi:hypothetical protein